MNKEKRIKLMAVRPDFLRSIKCIAAERGVTMLEFQKELIPDLEKYKREKDNKKREEFKFGF